MTQRAITEKDLKLAQLCRNCKAWSRARRNQRGFLFWFVKHIEGGLCPACQAYERVYGRKAHEPLTR